MNTADRYRLWRNSVGKFSPFKWEGRHIPIPFMPEDEVQARLKDARVWRGKLDAVDVMVEPYLCTFNGPCRGGHITFHPRLSQSTAWKLLWNTIRTFTGKKR